MTDTPLAGRFEIGPLLGAGGSSRVHQARDQRLDREVAIKILEFGHGDSRARERFLREALIGGRISHPDAVTVFDTGEDDGVLYIVMELVTGEDLAKRLARMGSLPQHEAVDIAVRVLDVLEAAHNDGVVHRDIKPSNILLADDGRARLVDFGIAKPLEDLTSGLTQTGQVIGTAKYLSPEQVGGQLITPSADLYSTGAVLFEALSGRPPFTGDNVIAMAIAHRDEAPPPLASVAPGVSPAVAAVVDQALAKDPASRPASAAAMATALRESVSGAAVATTAVLTLPSSELAGGDPVESTAVFALPSSEPAGGDPVESTAVFALPSNEPASGDPVESTAVFALPPSETPPAVPMSRRTLLIAALVGTALVFAAFAWQNRGGGDGDLALQTAPTDEVATTTAETTSIETTTTVAATTTMVQSLGALTDLLSASPEAYGEKGPDLLDKLQEVQRERGGDQREKAADLIEDIDDWVEDGELDPVIAEQARQLLADLARRGGGRSNN